ncbi:MAG TPA: tRNA preQ1(34) S-adenosylmethionine ribosyltransferase-isomerase QueA [Candidatus Dojkabacteria bacterium]|nr:tRNA preQ1(34) S-adenosylmethionine ribosyltransferase-isomerase QueA [Candidatus Dojkabacteria bacterium]
MELSLFDYNLPDDRIAKFPPKLRGTTNLMVIHRDSGLIEHKKYGDIVDYIQPNDIVVLNNTKVDKVRVFFTNKRNDKKIESIFLNKVYRNTDETYEYWEAILGRAKNVKDNDILVCDGLDKEVIVEGRIRETIFLLKAKKGDVDIIFKEKGHIPLPPYLNREDNKEDQERYNTIFAKYIGSAAAPTASLNITDEMLERLKEKEVKIAEVKLDVGWGTFAPIRTEKIEEHIIHSEKIEVTEETADLINETKAKGGKVWAFGTTAARTLESCTKDGKVIAFSGSTNIYIYPSYEWMMVDHLITNFHAPKSSLIVMISAFMGYDLTMKVYNEAIEKGYNFLSYGDTMLII